MRKPDPIFWAATALFALSLVLARFAGEGFLLLMLGAYLLRPTLHSLGFAMKLVDERQLQIQYRASNVAFAVMVIGSIVVILALMRQDNHAWEMVIAVLLTGVAVRALSGLLMVGDPGLAGRRVLIATGLLLGLFGFVEGDLKVAVVAHVIPGLILVGLALLARRSPKVVAGLLVLIVGLLVFWLLVMPMVRGGGVPDWGKLMGVLFLTGPIAVAAVCLLRAQASDESAPQPREAFSAGP